MERVWVLTLRLFKNKFNKINMLKNKGSRDFFHAFCEIDEIEKSHKIFMLLTMDAMWEKIKKYLKKTVKSGLFYVWIRPLEGRIEEGTLFLYSPNGFITSGIKEKLLDTIKKAALEVTGSEVDVVISTISRSAPSSSVSDTSSSSRPRGEEIFLPVRHPLYKNTPIWKYSFEEFVVGEENELAFAACKSVCKRDGFDFPSLFLSSSPGLGKTHLIHSIGKLLSDSKKEGPRVLYISSEQFANHLVWAIKTREMEEFKKFYRESVDLMLLEDVHFFQGKEKMQEELLSLLKDMEATGKMVILSSSFLPKELKGVDSQLTSHFCSGLLAPIYKPTLGLRVKIVERKAKKYNIHIPSQVSRFIASHIKGDIRQLEGCIGNMVIKARMFNRAIDMELAREVIENFISHPPAPTLEEIVEMVCRVFEVSPQLLSSKSRRRHLVLARNSIFYLARKFTDLSLKEIGQRFNRRHSTVIKGITNMEKEIYRDTPKGRQLMQLVERLEG